MFISLNELKALVVDLDSFPEEFDSEWEKIDLNTVSLLLLSQNEDRLAHIQQKNANFLLHVGTFGAFFNKRKTLIEVHKILDIESYELAVLSQNLEVLKYIQAMNVSTVYFSEGSYSDYKDVGNLPDFLVSTLNDINNILSGKLKGFFSEVASMIYKGRQIDFKQGTVIVSNKSYRNINSMIVSGGRYFSKADIRYPIHQLSRRIIRNKDYFESQVEIISSIYEDLIRFIEEQLEGVDALTRIPPRPSQEKDRLIDCVNFVCQKKLHIKNAASSLICVRDYESQKFLNQEERLSNIRDVFQVTDNFEGMHVVILDDIISTGATALEAAKELYQTGARKVTILVLAINQFNNFLITSNKSLECDNCGGELIMKFNRSNNSAFFGCNNWPSCNNSADFFEGVQAYNRLKKIEVEGEELEDPDWF